MTYFCPACHHIEHDPGSCEWCPRCELHTDDALAWLLRISPQDINDEIIRLMHENGQQRIEIAHLNETILRQHDCDHSECIEREEGLVKQINWHLEHTKYLVKKIALLRKIKKAAQEHVALFDTMNYPKTAAMYPSALAAALGEGTPAPAPDRRHAWCEACGYAHPINDSDCVEERNIHGYTCGRCDWGRSDQPRSKSDYDQHVKETGHYGEDR